MLKIKMPDSFWKLQNVGLNFSIAECPNLFQDGRMLDSSLNWSISDFWQNTRTFFMTAVRRFFIEIAVSLNLLWNGDMPESCFVQDGFATFPTSVPKNPCATKTGSTMIREVEGSFEPLISQSKIPYYDALYDPHLRTFWSKQRNLGHTMRLTGHVRDEWAPDSGIFESAIADELKVCYPCMMWPSHFMHDVTLTVEGVFTRSMHGVTLTFPGEALESCSHEVAGRSCTELRQGSLCHALFASFAPLLAVCLCFHARFRACVPFLLCDWHFSAIGHTPADVGCVAQPRRCCFCPSAATCFFSTYTAHTGTEPRRMLSR